jgi:hypothetical protein
MDDDDLTLIGEHYGYGRNASAPFGIARADRRQAVEVAIAVQALNRMLELGRPKSVRIA